MWKFLDDNGACIVLRWLLIMCHIKTVCIVPDITSLEIENMDRVSIQL